MLYWLEKILKQSCLEGAINGVALLSHFCCVLKFLLHCQFCSLSEAHIVTIVLGLC